jgi:NADH-quinone oxidoreductase subunit N
VTPYESLKLFGPEAIVTTLVVAVLGLDLLMRRRADASSKLVSLAIVGLAAALVACLPLARSVLRGVPTEAFSGMVAVDPLALFFKGFCLAVAILGVVFAALSDEIRPERMGEYLGLLLSLVLGMMLLSSANDLLMLYVSLEFVSLTSYVLAGWKRRSKPSSEAALKYVIYGAVASGIMLYGLSLLYGMAGTLSLPLLRERLAGAAVQGAAGQLALVAGVILPLAGFTYKIAAAPFHMWCPDVYEGAPTPFTAFLSVGPKAAGFAVLIRFFFVALGQPGADPAFPWPLILGVVAMATMTIGNLVALPQTNIKRLLAYSSIAHAGYLLLGVVVGNAEGLRAVLLYLCIYLLMNLGAFLVVIAVRNRTGSEEISAYRGLATRAPALAVLMAVFLFSLVGLPPLGGFIGKFYLFAALIHKGGAFFITLALVAVVNSAISLYYYARVLRTMFLDAAAPESGKLAVGPAFVGLLAILAVPTLGLGVYWHPLVALLSRAVRILGA